MSVAIVEYLRHMAETADGLGESDRRMTRDAADRLESLERKAAPEPGERAGYLWEQLRQLRTDLAQRPVIAPVETPPLSEGACSLAEDALLGVAADRLERLEKLTAVIPTVVLQGAERQAFPDEHPRLTPGMSLRDALTDSVRRLRRLGITGEEEKAPRRFLIRWDGDRPEPALGAFVLLGALDAPWRVEAFDALESGGAIVWLAPVDVHDVPVHIPPIRLSVVRPIELGGEGPVDAARMCGWVLHAGNGFATCKLTHGHDDRESVSHIGNDEHGMYAVWTALNPNAEHRWPEGRTP